MPTIHLCRDYLCQYSPQDAAKIEAYGWMLQRTPTTGRYYAYTYEQIIDPSTGLRKRKKLYMHRLVAGSPPGLLVDHADRDGLNNRRWNLRVTTGTFNAANADHGVNLCGYRGVTAQNSRFRARIKFRGDDIHIGMYATAREAAEAYDTRALELFGVFAWRNFRDDATARRDEWHEEDVIVQEQRDMERIPF